MVFDFHVAIQIEILYFFMEFNLLDFYSFDFQ